MYGNIRSPAIQTADFKQIETAVSKLPEEWQDWFGERWRLMAGDHPAPYPVWALRDAYIDTVKAARDAQDTRLVDSFDG